MALPPLPDTAIHLGAHADDWRAAVRLSAAALARAGVARPAYGDDMIRMIEEHGPYVVIAPGLALAHARPTPDVLRTGLAVVTLDDPVRFGHPHNDPVGVLLGLAVREADEHIQVVASLANVFNDSDVIQALAAARTPDAVRAALGVGEEAA